MSGRAHDLQRDDLDPALDGLLGAAELVFARVRAPPSARVEALAGAVRALTGEDPEALLAAPEGLRGLVDPRDLAAYDAALAAQEPRDQFVRWRPRGGAERWVRHTSVPWLDGHGRTIGSLCVIRGAAAPAGPARDDDLLQAINDGILVNDPGGAIEFANARLARMLGTTPEAMLGRRIFDFMDAEAAAQARENLRRRRAGAEDQFDFRFRRTDGAPVWCIVSAKPLYGAQGEHRGSLVAITDITARRLAEDELRRTRDELERRVEERTAQLTREVQVRERAEAVALAASRTKSAFLARMSHELRTPLNAILGYTELLAEEHSEPALAGDLGRIHGAATHLLALLNDILDLSKIEAAKMQVVRDAFVVGELLDELRATVLPAALKNGDALRVVCAERERVIVSDRTRLKQILLNLLGNAVKFTRGGSVELRVTFEREGAARRLVAVVADTGPGIAPDRLPGLFSAYAQADGSIAREFGGTGLGLAISRELCALLGGEIAVESALGEGTAFTVRLPAPPP